MVGSLGNLYESIENVSESYMQPNRNKDSLLNPRASTSASQLLVLPAVADHDESMSRKVYMCSDCKSYVAEEPSLDCPDCGEEMYEEVPFVARTAVKGKSTNEGEGGFVKDVVTYMVMDDLAVKPMSTISAITLLREFNVKEIGGLVEKVVDLGMDKSLKLLKSSLQSKSVLTDVFLGNTKA